MTMSGYEKSLQYIYSLIKFGIKLGLENPKKILSIIGDPHKSFKSIHIAGTNGKGSTSKILHTLLIGSGFKTGLFTSPHMVRFTERIIVNNEEISPEYVIALTDYIKTALSKDPNLKPTYFEFITALAFEYFKQCAVQWAVVETGMGGRFDATNVITPEVAIITTVGLDHREFLGESLEKIAYEKAGIIKKNVPLILGPISEAAKKVILNEAALKGVKVRTFGKDFYCKVKEVSIRGTVFDFYSSLLNAPLKELYIPAIGEHQAENAAIAIEAFLLTTGTKSVTLLRDCLKKVNIKGRFEIVEFSERRFILDGAHNSQAMETLFKTINRVVNNKKPITIFGAMSDKDIADMLLPLLEGSSSIIFTRPSYERAESPRMLYQMALNLKPDLKKVISTAETVADAVQKALKLSSSDDILLITGSFYVVGEAKELMGESAILKTLREAH